MIPKHGDRVKMKWGDGYVHGQVTVTRPESNESKVLFDEDWAPDYWYYSNDELELDNDDYLSHS